MAWTNSNTRSTRAVLTLASTLPRDRDMLPCVGIVSAATVAPDGPPEYPGEPWGLWASE
jgi:hypothetical protein